MRAFSKYFWILLLAQILFTAFVLFTGLVLGHAVGDGILYFLYAVPLMLLLFAGRSGTGGDATIWLFVGVLALASLYAAILASLIAFIKGLLSHRNET